MYKLTLHDTIDAEIDGEAMLMPDSEWARNSRYITAVGSTIYGFDVDGNLWSHDALLHINRDYQMQFPSISGITSDGERLIFISNGTIMASRGLGSLELITFDRYSYDISFDRVTAMGW